MAILADDGMDWTEKLKKYAADRTSGQNEYTRASQVYNYKTALGDNEGAAAAKKWMGQVDTAMGGANTSSSSKLNNLSDQYNTYLTNMMQRKAFDPTTDTTYQSALAAAKQKAQQGATTATNNAMVSLGSRGIGNSSVAVDRANQIQQAANTQLQTQIEPQLLEQALSRYMQEQTLKQQDLTNLGNAVNTQSSLDQNAFNNNLATQQAALQQKQANLSAATAVGNQLGRVLNPKEDWSNLYNQTDAPLNMDAQNAETQKNQWKSQFDRGVYESDRNFDYTKQMDAAKMEQSAQQFAQQMGIDWAKLNQSQQQFIAEYALKQKQLDAESNPYSLDNQYKQAQIDSLKSKTTTSGGIDKYDLAQIDSLAKDSNLDISSANPNEILSFVASLKGKYGWSLDEAQKVEQYLTSQQQEAQKKKAAAKANEKPKPFGYRYIGG